MLSEIRTYLKGLMNVLAGSPSAILQALSPGLWPHIMSLRGLGSSTSGVPSWISQYGRRRLPLCTLMKK